MAVTKDVLLRYTIIDKCLRNKQKPYPTMAEIQEALQAVGCVSVTTIKRDLEAMRHDGELNLRAPIAYCARNRGYYYTQPDYSIHTLQLKEQHRQSLAFLQQVLAHYQNNPLIKPYLNLQQQLLKNQAASLPNYLVVQPESKPEITGNEYFPFLKTNAEGRQPIQLTYSRFTKKPVEPTTHLFHPYILKEYKHRWYTIGYSTTRKRMATFALERIVRVEKDPVTPYFRHPKFNALTYHEHAIGISANPLAEPMEVRLKFTPQQARYVKSVPLHKTQRLIGEDETGSTFEIRVTMSYELVQLIVSHGYKVKVVSPVKLAKTVYEVHRKAMELYRQDFEE
jgi:predicted DNA-binding transcriptional regulator YafY